MRSVPWKAYFSFRTAPNSTFYITWPDSVKASEVEAAAKVAATTAAAATAPTVATRLWQQKIKM